jgi:cation transporter-like permease
MPAAWYAFFSMLRVVAVLWLVAMIWLRARERWGRSGSDPDDLAGPMTGAEDALIVRFT